MEWISRNKYWLAAIGFFVLSIALRFLAADQTSHPSGWDGYYYVMQIHSWLTYGYLQSPDFSLIYPYFAAIAFVTNDFILAYKIGVALLSGLLILTVFYSLSKRQVSFAWTCIICSYLVFSPLATYFILQFPKNVLGLIFLVLFVSSLPNRIMAFVFLVATVLTHRMTGGFALIAAVVYGLKYVPWKWLAAGAVVLIAISFLPGVLHISDLQRLNGQFQVVPQWAPFSFHRIFPNSLTWMFKAELVMITLLIAFAVYFNIRQRPSTWFLIGLICIFPFFEFSPGDAGHRFFLVAPIAFILAMPFEKLQLRFPAVFVTVLLVASVFAYRSYKPGRFDPPNSFYMSTIDRLVKSYNPHDYPLVIAHQPLAEMIIFKTDFDALNWLPPDDMPPQRVLRLINGVQYPDFRKYLEEADYRQIRSISRGYFTAPEDVWQKFVQKTSNETDNRLMKAIYSDFNPMTRRPYFINKGRIR